VLPYWIYHIILNSVDRKQVPFAADGRLDRSIQQNDATTEEEEKKTAHTEHEHTQVIIDFRPCQRGSGDEKENNRSVRCGHAWKLSISFSLHKQLTARKATKAPDTPTRRLFGMARGRRAPSTKKRNETHLAVRAGDLGEDAHDGSDQMQEPHLGSAILSDTLVCFLVSQR
jgi:hypothetical protein